MGEPSLAAQRFSQDVDKALGIGPRERGGWRDVALAEEDGSGGVVIVYAFGGGDVIQLETVLSLEPLRRSGKPTQALRAITELADEHGVTIRLDACPFGERALTREQLVYFYRKHGFEPVQEGEGPEMIRWPRVRV